MEFLHSAAGSWEGEPTVKLLQSEDCPSKIWNTTENYHQSKSSSMVHSSVMGCDDVPPGFGGKGYSDISNEPCVSQVEWNCPPMFMMSGDWLVVAGEESTEKETQKCREFAVLEAVYPRASAIPRSPLVSPDIEECDYDDGRTPLIPLIPIEDVDALRNDSPTCSKSGATSQDVVSVNSSEQNFPGVLKTTVYERPVGVFNGVNSDFVAAASASFTPQYLSIVSEPSAVSRQADARVKIQKPCRFFNGSSGCKRGLSCPFEHVSLVKRAGNFPDADSTKRFKFSG